MKSYLITDPEYYSEEVKSFSNYLEKIYQNHCVDYSCFRDKKNSNKKELAKIFLKFSKKYNIQKTLINSDIEIAKELGFFGVHLNSKQLKDIKKAKEKNLFVIISTHTTKELELAIQNGVDAVTFSPIFQTPNKGEPKGVEVLKELAQTKKVKIFALGGIVTKKQMQKCQDAGVYGFASIRYFL